MALARENGCLLQIEVHKRFDPIYNDARQRIQKLGEFNFFTSYMSHRRARSHADEWAARPAAVTGCSFR